MDRNTSPEKGTEASRTEAASSAVSQGPRYSPAHTSAWDTNRSPTKPEYGQRGGSRGCPNLSAEETSTIKPATPPVTLSPDVPSPSSDSQNKPELPPFSAPSPVEDQPWQSDQPNREERIETGTIQDEESLSLSNHDDDGNEDNDDNKDSNDNNENNAPRLSNTARYFWSRLDVAYQLYVDDQDEECSEVIREALMRARVPIARRCELLQLLACVVPWKDAQNRLDEADELSQEMDRLVPNSERVTQLKTKGNNIRGSLKAYHEIPDDSDDGDSATEDEEMDDFAKEVEQDIHATDSTEEDTSAEKTNKLSTDGNDLLVPEGTREHKPNDEKNEAMHDVGH